MLAYMVIACNKMLWLNTISHSLIGVKINFSNSVYLFSTGELGLNQESKPNVIIFRSATNQHVVQLYVV